MYLGNQPALSYTSFAKQDFTTSATTNYVLDQAVTNANEIALFINFVRQEPTTAYTASGTALTLTAATSASDDMYCIFLGKALQTVNPPAGSVGASQITDGSITSTKLGYDYNQYRNIIINGDMSIAQRGTSTASITSTGYYTVDRWNMNIATGGTWTQSQDTSVPTGQGFATSLKMACTTANASLSAGSYFSLRQKFEGQMLQYLKKGTANAQSLTASFWIKSNKTGTYCVMLYDADNTRAISKTISINSADTWEKKTLTYAGDTTGVLGNDNAYSFALELILLAGTNYTSGTQATSWESYTSANVAPNQTVNLADSTSNYINITGVQLEAGTTASDFEFLPVDVNLDRCYRYFQFIGGTLDATFATGISTSSTTSTLQMDFLKTMRTSPTISVSGTLFITDNYSYNTNFSSISSSNLGVNSGRVAVTHSSGATTNRPAFMQAENTTPSDNGIQLSAEL